MDIQGFLDNVFRLVNNGYKLDTKHTLINDQYHMSNYVYNAIHAIACYNEKDSLIDVKISVRDSNNVTHTITEQYSVDGTRLGVYMA